MASNPSHPFMSGHGFRNLCGWEYRDHKLHPTEGQSNYCIFARIEQLDGIRENLPDSSFILITHNTDYSIGSNWADLADNNKLITWYSQNLEMTHPKVKALPIGLANIEWGHGNTTIFSKHFYGHRPKTKMLSAAFRFHTHPQRKICAETTGIVSVITDDYDTYLTNLDSSYFTLSPRGNGPDCHRLWEALYLRTIPIVLRDRAMTHFAHLPILMLDSWDEFNTLTLDETLYTKIWRNFDPETLLFDNYVRSHFIGVLNASAGYTQVTMG